MSPPAPVDPTPASAGVAPVPVAALLEEANRGDSAALGALLKEFQGFVEAQFRRQRTDQGRAPDADTVRQLVQDVFVRVHSRISAKKTILGGVSGFRAYLRETAWHIWLDRVAGGTGHEIPFPTVSDPDEPAGHSNPLDHAAAPGGDLLDQLLSAESRDEEEDLLNRRIWEAADDLERAHPSKQFRLLLELQVGSWRNESRGGKRTTQTEMAKAMGCSQALISGRLTELFRLLRSHLE